MSWKGPKVGQGMLDFEEDVFVGIITVDTIWNIGETGDIYNPAFVLPHLYSGIYTLAAEVRRNR